MNKILNPFEYLSTGKALGWGLAGTLFSICRLTAVSWHDSVVEFAVVAAPLAAVVRDGAGALALPHPGRGYLCHQPVRDAADDRYSGSAESLCHVAGEHCLRTPQRLRGLEAGSLQSDRDRPVGFDGLVDGLGLFRLPRFGQYERMEEHRRFCDLLCLRECGQPIADRIHQIGRSAVRRYAEPLPGSVFRFGPTMDGHKKNMELQAGICSAIYGWVS